MQAVNVVKMADSEANRFIGVIWVGENIHVDKDFSKIYVFVSQLMD